MNLPQKVFVNMSLRARKNTHMEENSMHGNNDRLMPEIGMLKFAGALSMKKSYRKLLGSAALCAGFGLAAPALAEVEYDQFVTPDVIFGSGNVNGGFTTDRVNGIELGLRAKVPFGGVLNSNGDGSYSYTLDETGTEGSRRWNFDWTINTDYDFSSGLKLDDLTYELGMDADPGVGTNFLKFDPVATSDTQPYWDHSIGDNTTSNGGGVVATDNAGYLSLLANNNVLQQSWRYAFFSTFPPLTGYDADEPGVYTVYLLARDGKGKVVARTEILVLIGLSAGLPASVDECTKGGWQAFDSLFNKQGDCVKFVKTSR